MVDEFIDADEAVALLGVKHDTLYAYVSRGQIRSRHNPGGNRRRLYSLRDITELNRRKEIGRKPVDVAASALNLGFPALTSAISQVENGRLVYRGQDAVELAQRATLEQAAALLWQCDVRLFDRPAPLIGPPDRAVYPGATIEERLRHDLPRLGPSVPIWQREAHSLIGTAIDMLRGATALLTGCPAATAPIHLQLARAWDVPPEQADLLRRALVLAADHELSPATFCTRVIASTGASLSACISGGLAAFGGPRHGGEIGMIEQLFAEAAASSHPERAIIDRLARGDRLPRFGLQMHELGDPRALLLLAGLPADPLRDALLHAMEAVLGKRPAFTFALVAMRHALGLPDEAAQILFLCGRLTGWIAHVLEQNGDQNLIRPRARYSGEPPPETGSTA
ncbi:MAG: citrate synthase family protein [Chelatococcus sp.]|uniref:citrate/2-methylcitrate synthase n=1 Tax=Chelatococcus sp. TaxID=1953771 RepID=UPI0025BE9BE0|nr:citrate/2-methylcitrate synthase [Chelatococcus sp.]MBX3538514.1 citrate synthase family protein [Chelatococcus sp.]